MGRTHDTDSLSVLVVEDLGDAAWSPAGLLTLYGYAVRVAGCGAGALREAGIDPPDVVLLDIRLPDIDGWELALQSAEELESDSYRTSDTEFFHAPPGRAVGRARSASRPSSLPAPTFRTTLRTFAQAPDPPAADRLTEPHIQTACDERGVAFATRGHHVRTPALTLWAFLTQGIRDSPSCAAAVARAPVLRGGLGRRPCPEATGADGKARAKLPVALLSRLATQRGDELERPAATTWQWKGRRVLPGDGTTVSGPDTPANQAAYPPHHTQK